MLDIVFDTKRDWRVPLKSFSPVSSSPPTRDIIVAMRVLLMLVMSAATFEDLSSGSGIVARLYAGSTPAKHLIETMVGGVALLDYDNDGKLDIYLANGAEQPSLTKTSPAHSNRLYRNLGNFKFEDVTDKAGVAGFGFDIGVAAADYDNDGNTDLFIAGVAGNLLYRNLGNGTFEDVTLKAKLSKPTTKPWAVAAGWFDMENDGDLDLFVVNYVQWNPASEPVCGGAIRTFCHPREYKPLTNTLYRNNADGSFTDVSVESGIAAHPGKGMGLAFGDIDGDNLLDIFVTNDTESNFLFHNLGKGRFNEIAGPAGVAFNDDGRALSAMGADFRDWDNDGRDDLFLTALTNETFPLYRNAGKLQFTDRTYASLVGKATLAFSGWSNGVYDMDNDGLKDLFAACSDVQDNTELYSGRASKQRNLLMINRGDGSFAAQLIGSAARHRGAAFGDLDGDGQIDAVITRIGDTPLVLKNSFGANRHWLSLRLRGTTSNRSAIGASVEIQTADGRKQTNRVSSAVGYASSSELAVHFGLGRATSVATLTIRWPSGKIQTLKSPTIDRYLDVNEP